MVLENIHKHIQQRVTTKVKTGQKQDEREQ
jgi:hypothetical protein